MANHCNNYGFSAAFAAVFAAISWYLVQDRSCKINLSYFLSETFNNDHLQLFHYIAIIVGVVIFVLSFFDFAGIVSDIAPLFVLSALGIYAAGAMMLYATYIAFHMSCKSAFNSVFDTVAGAKNVIEANDEIGITIMVLDLICACLLISAAISFTRTY